VKIYLVGGAVRDQLLGYPVKERDWVVVGATPQEMLTLGYRPVGKDFPVFLHPTTHEEYALARTERKTGPGYKGFNFYAAPDVTLEEDLQRRDLTINAMAQESDGAIIDPCGGKKDLDARLLRHVSPAFVEDPVRILRVARFAARFAEFHLHTDTLQLMQNIVRDGEVHALVAERVWQECEKALREAHPARFFEVLSNCGALSVLFPEFVQKSVGFQALPRAKTAIARFAVLFYGLDIQSARAVLQRYRVPKNYSELALLICGYYADYEKVFADAALCLALLEHLDAFRRPERLSLFFDGCEAIANSDIAVQKSERLHSIYVAAKSVEVSDLASQNIPGQEIRKILRERRLVAIEKFFVFIG